MKKLFYIFLISHISYLISNICFSQNLVPNPSFEQYTSCPSGMGEITFATNWMNFNQYSPDYYNLCATVSSQVSVPNNIAGYQHPADGIAYAGIYTYESDVPNVREYIGAQLLIPLVISTKYYFSFKTNLALDTNHIFNQASNNIGMLFSTIPYSQSNPVNINNFAHIYSTSVITDTLNWTTISGSFIADSAYKYIIIGNFFDDANTGLIQMQDTVFYRSAYYYIDNVYVSTDSIPGGIAGYDLQGKIKVYPTPFMDSAIIEINDFHSDDFQVSIYNSFGREIRKYSKVKKEIKINREDLLNGIYFLKVEMKDKVYTQKFIIQ